tara:strand:- start:1097 stop:1489 length:393 start_codon:yes stop_codon:yes gene_type:complete
MGWVLLMLMGCEPAEPAAPDWDRCEDAYTPEEKSTCCFNSGVYDCRVGFQAVEVLHGPPNAAQPEAAHAFELRCDEDFDDQYADLYCEGYCSACPEYRSFFLRYPETDYAGEESGQSTTPDYMNDCYCSD